MNRGATPWAGLLLAALTAMTAILSAGAGRALAEENLKGKEAPPQAAGLKAGLLLVATGNISVQPFARSVILLTNYGSAGALGVIINKPLPVRLRDAVPQMKSLRGAGERLFYGGPVSRNVLTLLLESGEDLEKADGAVRVFGDVFFVANKDVIHRALAAGDKPSRSFSGYAGWAPGQLENEISRGDWKIETAGGKSLFFSDPARLWEKFQDKGANPGWTYNAPPGQRENERTGRAGV